MITLLGAPRAVLADSDALDAAARRLLDGLGIDVHLDVGHAVTIAVPSVGLFVRDRPAIDGCFAWYVGPGAAPSWMHPADPAGVGATTRILALLGTALAQERAGAAFRAAGRGQAAPEAVEYDAGGILTGIATAVTSSRARPASTPAAIPVDDLLRVSFAAIDRCCAPNGAIAASPPSDGGPDYWFFWPRDAAHVAYALHLLSRHGPRELREPAARRVAGWVEFVSGLGRDLGAAGLLGSSRCSMSGQPIGGYGDPQHDGPAATALVLLAVLPDPLAALAAARPYLQHLMGHDGPGYDLWELVRGRSFHAEQLRWRALRRAADLAAVVGDPGASTYLSATRPDRLADFRCDGTVRHVLDADPPWFDLLSGVDASTVGAMLLAGPDALGLVDPGIEAVAAELVAVSARRGSAGIMRFPEDANDGLGSTGGRPWPVATLWVAQWYLHRSRLAGAADPICDRGHGLRHLAAVLAGGTADLGEQLDWRTGEARGARPLAWSHAELVVTLLTLPGPGLLSKAGLR